MYNDELFSKQKQQAASHQRILGPSPVNPYVADADRICWLAHEALCTWLLFLSLCWYPCAENAARYCWTLNHSTRNQTQKSVQVAWKEELLGVCMWLCCLICVYWPGNMNNSSFSYLATKITTLNRIAMIPYKSYQSRKVQWFYWQIFSHSRFS